MKPIVGQIIGLHTEDAIGAEDGAYKYHLCVNSELGHYLFVCSIGYAYDFPLPQYRCPDLPNAVSYVSLSRIIYRSSLPTRRRLICTVTDDFLRELLFAAEDFPTLSPKDKRTIVDGIEAYLNR